MPLQEYKTNMQKVLDSLENTWRNVVVGSIFVIGAIGGGVYFEYTRMYRSLMIEPNQTVVRAPQPTEPQVLGLKQYSLSVIGGDVSSEEPKVSIPEKRQMFIPFDTRLISAAAVLVKDRETGKVLFGQNEYAPRSLASITKLLSMMVIEEYISDWDAVVTAPSDTIFDSHVYPHEMDTLKNWYEVALVASSNRAVLTVVDATGKTREEFIQRMNEKAHELGMSNSHFTDPTGIDAGNVSTASDAAILFAEALRHDRIVETISLPSVDYTSSLTKKNKTIWSTNWLLTNWIHNSFKDPVIGKTGYIVESDYNFVGKFTKAEKGDLIIVALGSNSEETRFTDAVSLADWAFTNFEWSK